MSSDYSPEAFDEALEEYKKQLGDLYGIETAAEAVRDYAYNTPEENAEQGPRSNYTLTIPASSGSFSVHPVLPIAETFDYQGWIRDAGRLRLRRALGQSGRPVGGGSQGSVLRVVPPAQRPSRAC